MKKLILVFVMWPMMVSVFGQNQRKSITDTVFQLDQAIVLTSSTCHPKIIFK